MAAWRAWKASGRAVGATRAVVARAGARGDKGGEWSMWVERSGFWTAATVSVAVGWCGAGVAVTGAMQVGAVDVAMVVAVG